LIFKTQKESQDKEEGKIITFVYIKIQK